MKSSEILAAIAASPFLLRTSQKSNVVGYFFPGFLLLEFK